MKLNRIILPIMACTLTLGSCDDQIMEWKESDKNITISDIPLALKEKLANYDYIKAYAKQYTPNMISVWDWAPTNISAMRNTSK